MIWSVQPAIFKHVCKEDVKSEYELYHVCPLAQNRVVSTGQIGTEQSGIHRTDWHRTAWYPQDRFSQNFVLGIFVKTCLFFFLLIKIKQE